MSEWETVFEAINDEEQLIAPVRAMRSILEAVSLSLDPTDVELMRFEHLVKQAKKSQVLQSDQGRISWSNPAGERSESFALILECEDLLLHGDSARIKRCPGDGCHVIFYDGSKNQSKKWCAMAHCGMLTKSKKFYDNHRRVMK
ncbi:MAG: CGNR zinc finger domain-containing protein [Actinomycetes bacterium]